MLNIDWSFYNIAFFQDYLWQGLVFSVQLTVVAAIGGIFFGTFLALMRLSPYALLQYPSKIYVNAMRSIPLVLVILWFYLIIPLLIGSAIDAKLCAFITFVAFEAAYFSEIIRAGIASVSTGQAQAASALGMSYGQKMRLIVLPQAFRNMVPVFLTQIIVLFQDTSLVYSIGAYDLLKGFETAGRNFNRPIETFLLAAVMYFCICFGLSKIAKMMETRWRKTP